MNLPSLGSKMDLIAFFPSRAVARQGLDWIELECFELGEKEKEKKKRRGRVLIVSFVGEDVISFKKKSHNNKFRE